MSNALEISQTTDNDQIKRLKNAKTASPLSIDPINKQGIFSGSSSTPYTTTLYTCTCRDFIVRRQPCKHMYRLGLELGTIKLDSNEHNLNETITNMPNIKNVSYKKKLKANVNSFVVVDLETTGLSAGTDKIIEIGAIKVIDGKIVDTFSSLINPCMPIPPQASAVNKITDNMVVNQPTFKEILPAFINFIDSLPLVAHNAPFDGKFLAWTFAEESAELTNQVIDTLALSRKLFPNSPNHKLGTLKNHLKLSGTASHRALEDAYVTYLLYIKCFEIETGTTVDHVSPPPKGEEKPTYTNINTTREVDTCCAQHHENIHRHSTVNVTSNQINTVSSSKNKYLSILLCIFLGYFGAHRLYAGKIGTAILYFFTCGLFGIGVLFDLILLICNKFTDKNGFVIR